MSMSPISLPPVHGHSDFDGYKTDFQTGLT